MQRLFSTFPLGRAGLGLLLLRLVSAAQIVFEVDPDPARLLWLTVIGLALALLLIAGLATPYASLAAAGAHLAAWYLGPYETLVAVALASGTLASLALIGPGAYSVDARLFGRRVISVSAEDPVRRR